MGKLLKRLIFGGLIVGSLYPLRSVANDLSVVDSQTFSTNGVNITSDLRINNDSELTHPQSTYSKQNISADLLERGCEDINNGLFNWEYHSLIGDFSEMTTNSIEQTYAIKKGFTAHFNYTIPTNAVVGWQTVQAEMVAPAGTVPFDYIVPITPTTTTINGTTVDVLQRAGFTNDNTMAYFEDSSVQNSDSDTWTDVEEWVAGTNPNVADGLEGVLNVVSNGVEVSTFPNVAERVYDVSFKTNLMDSAWMPAGSYTNNVGQTDGFFMETNGWDAVFYKAKVTLP